MTAPYVPAPLLPAKKPSIVDRLLNRFLPIDQGYADAGVFTPEQESDMRRRGLLDFGARLLAANGPDSSGFLPNVGSALAGVTENWPKNLQDAAAASTALQSRAQALHQQQRREEILQQYQAQPNETPPQMLARLQAMQQAFLQEGDKEMIVTINDVLKNYNRGENAKALDWKQIGNQLTGLNPITGEIVIQYPNARDPNDKTAENRARLASEFISLTKPEQQAALAYKRIVATAAQPQNQTTDQALLYNYLILLSPNATLGQTDKATQDNAPGVPKPLMDLYNLVMGGSVTLDAARRSQIINQSRTLARSAYDSFKPQYDRYSAEADREGLPVEGTVYNWFQGLPGMGGPVSDEACKALKTC